jgi:hypothetical protein
MKEWKGGLKCWKKFNIYNERKKKLDSYIFFLIENP